MKHNVTLYLVNTENGNEMYVGTQDVEADNPAEAEAVAWEALKQAGEIPDGYTVHGAAVELAEGMPATSGLAIRILLVCAAGERYPGGDGAVLAMLAKIAQGGNQSDLLQ